MKNKNTNNNNNNKILHNLLTTNRYCKISETVKIRSNYYNINWFHYTLLNCAQNLIPQDVN